MTASEVSAAAAAVCSLPLLSLSEVLFETFRDFLKLFMITPSEGSVVYLSFALPHKRNKAKKSFQFFFLLKHCVAFGPWYEPCDNGNVNVSKIQHYWYYKCFL